MSKEEILKYVCEIFNKHKVKYIIIGGMAVAYHGHSRSTMLPNGQESDKFDIDILYQPTLTNNFNLIKSLKELGFDIHGSGSSSFPVYSKDFDEFGLDFLPYLPGLENTELSKKRELFSLYYNKRDISIYDGVKIPFISLDDLIEIKKFSSRPKDLEDIEELKKKNGL
jgi:predicted nucleotidyltransferase